MKKIPAPLLSVWKTESPLPFIVVLLQDGGTQKEDRAMWPGPPKDPQMWLGTQTNDEPYL